MFLPNFSKIDPYNFELYRFKLGAFFLRHSVVSVVCVEVNHEETKVIMGLSCSEDRMIVAWVDIDTVPAGSV